MNSCKPSSPEARQAAEEILRRRAARKSLCDFTLYTKPDYQVNWHHRVFFECLDHFASGKIKRLMVFAPPRHGKSEVVSRRLPAYLLGRNPDAKIIACSHTAELASTMNRDVQRIMDGPEYGLLFPKTKLYGKNIRTVAHGSYLRNSDIFEVVNRRGVYRSAGIGGGITGRGGDYLIIDDIVKDAAVANSPTWREATWEWYTSTFYSRQAKGAGICITLTRWHDDDLAGRLLKRAAEDPGADQWTVIRFPAVAEEGAPGYDPRLPGEALWPDLFAADFFAGIKAQSPHVYAALYQQRPQLREGGMFKREWFTRAVDASPAEGRLVRFWDRAATPGGGCYTCGVLMRATPDGRYYVEHVVRGQWSPRERDLVMLQTAQADRELFPANPPAIRVEREGGSSGLDSVGATASLFAGFNIRSVLPTGSKEVRAEPYAAQCEAGNVYLVRSPNRPWGHAAYIEELCLFPNGAYADQVDASSGAFNELTGGRVSTVQGDLLCWPPPPPKAEERGAAPDRPRRPSDDYFGAPERDDVGTIDLSDGRTVEVDWRESGLWE